MTRATLAIIAALSFVAAGQAQPVTIKLKERGEGETVLIKKNANTTSIVSVADGQGNKLLDKKEVMADLAEYKETVFKRQPGKPATKLQREYTKVLNSKDGRLLDDSLQGKTVVIEKKDGKYVFTYKDGEAVEGAAATALNKDFGKKSETNSEIEKLVLPGKAVKAGDSWKIEMPKIVTELSKFGEGEMELNSAKSKGEGKLLKVYQKKGMQFGEMQFKMEIPIVTIGKGQQQLKFNDGAKLTIDLTLDACIDGASEAGTMKMKMVMAGDATNAGAPGATITMNVTVEGTQVQADVPKK
jgi:hypothetical protein